METGVNKLLEGTGEAIKTVPELYDDGLKPAVQESGKTLSLLPKTINAALVPLRKWIAEREYSLAETEKLLEIKLRNIDYNKIVTPEAYVAVPALQAHHIDPVFPDGRPRNGIPAKPHPCMAPTLLLHFDPSIFPC